MFWQGGTPNNQFCEDLLTPHISKFVRVFDDCEAASTVKIRDVWKGELGIDLSNAAWDRSLRHRLIQFKMVQCLRYDLSNGNRLHLFKDG